MKISVSKRLFRSLIVVSLLSAHSVWAYSIQGRVVGVSDGDTITVLDSTKTQHKIRLAGIDAPEKKQTFGQASKKRLSNLVFGREVVLDCGKTDRYRREVCVVMVDGQDANLAQVKAGMAWWYWKYKKEQTSQQRVSYEAAEATAKAGRVGLWSEADPVPPWEWRHPKREN
jgi:endonuclease YncB( thermonuclease family)